MAGWNFAEIWERDRRQVPGRARPGPGRPAHHLARVRPPGRRRRPHAARWRGAEHQDKVALYLYNCPEYLEGVLRRLQGRRWSRSTPTTATSTTSSSTCGTTPTPSPSSSTAPSPTDRARSATGSRRCGTGCGSTTAPAPVPDWADALRGGRGVGRRDGCVAAAGPRSGDDILMIYTGGTTGMPKGVMWRQDDLIRATCATGLPMLAQDPERGRRLRRVHRVASHSPGPPGLPACPLMHGTGWFTANIYLTAGRLGRHPRRPQARRRSSCSTPSSASASAR